MRSAAHPVQFVRQVRSKAFDFARLLSLSLLMLSLLVPSSLHWLPAAKSNARKPLSQYKQYWEAGACA
eukprot:212922-Rhodomonas_salina.1